MSRNRIFILLGMALLLFCAASVRAQDKTLTVRPIAEAPNFAKLALVIGVGHYEHAGILAPATENDARNFAELLRTQFKFPENAITLLTDEPGTPESRRPTYIRLRNALKTLLASINEKSEVIVYFSGHGIRAENHDWLVPLDYVPDDLTSTCINYDDFKNQLNTKLPARALLIVDACRNLTGGKGAGSNGFGAGEGLSGPQFAELLSCQPKQESKVGKPEDFNESVFTHFLLQGLKGDPDALDNGVVTFDSLKLFVQGSVSQYVTSKYGEAQKPDGRASLGKMVLARGQVVVHRKPDVTQPDPGKAAHQDVEQPHLNGGYGDVAQGVKTKINPKDGAVMIWIPSGEFLMGDDDDQIKDIDTGVRNNPRHKVTLSGYWIYKDLVTVGMYKRFCQATSRQMPHEPEFPKGNYFNSNWSKEDHPMVDVSWDDAVAYCEWAGVTLPTEAQWEKTARGADGRLFPWGNTFDPNKLWASKSQFGDAGGTHRVGELGISPYGCTDMAGNVWQWCTDFYATDFWGSRLEESANPVNLSVGRKIYRVVRGGSWVSGAENGVRKSFRGRLAAVCSFRASYRGWLVPGSRDGDVGFRGALTP